VRPSVLGQLTAPGGGSPLVLASVAEEHDGDVVHGAAHSPEHGLFPIRDGILDLLPDGVGPRTPGQLSNELGLVARGYEWPWRVNSLSLLSHERFPFQRERAIFDQLLGTVEGTLWLDLAASTALYGRWLAPRLFSDGGEVVSLDFAWPMLQKARQAARAEGQKNLSFVRARAEALPFASGTLDGVVCGGSLNEFGAAGVVAALQEVARALRPGGTALFMHLLAAEGGLDAAFQRYVARPGGIAFWSRAETDSLFQGAGLQMEERRDIGVVGFTRVMKSGSRAESNTG
jgi:SAM-dependent methyltransferase